MRLRWVGETEGGWGGGKSGEGRGQPREGREGPCASLPYGPTHVPPVRGNRPPSGIFPHTAPIRQEGAAAHGRRAKGGQREAVHVP